MKVFVLQPTGQKSYQLFDTMVETFMSQGHTFIEKAVDADVIFYDLWNLGGVYCKRDVDTILFWQKPVVVFDFKDQWGSPQHRPNWWGFDDNKILGEMSAKDQRWAVHLKQFLEAGLVKLCLMRKMAKSWEYPEWVRPIEVAMWPDHDFEPVSKGEFSSRPNDICFIGNATPWRANLAFGMASFSSGYGICEEFLKFDCFFPFIRLEHEEWLSRHREAKFFVEADGGGFGSERPMQLITVSAMIRQKNDQRMAYPWVDGINCVEIGNTWGQIEDGDSEKIFNLLHIPDDLHQIYLNGIQHAHDYYTPEARSRYVLEQMATVGLK